MTDEQDVRAAFTRLVAAGPPPSGSAVALAAGRRARHRRTAAVLGTAAAVLAVLAAVSLVPDWRPLADPPAASPSPFTVPLMPEAPLTAEQTTRAVTGCTAKAQVDRAGWRVYSATVSGNVTGAVLVNDGEFFYCEWPWGDGDGPPVAGSPAVTAVSRFAAEPPAPVTRDLTYTRSPIDPAADDAFRARGTVVVVGRAGPTVEAVSVRLGPDLLVGGDVYNGVYVARFTSMSGPLPYSNLRVVVTAEDAQGSLLGRAP